MSGTRIRFEPWLCSGCRLCELGCAFHFDREASLIGGSLMLYRNEKKNYVGLMLKRPADLILARPEGVEILRPEERGEGDSKAKPITMRRPCNDCAGETGEPFCARACPTGSITAA